MKVILVADDERSFRETVKRLLQAEHEPVTVYEAASGDEAIRLTRQLHPDVVVLDLSMPGCNGLQASRRIRSEWPGARILVCSVHTHPSYRGAALEAGADDFLAKKSLGVELAPWLHRVWQH